MTMCSWNKTLLVGAALAIAGCQTDDLNESQLTQDLTHNQQLTHYCDAKAPKTVIWNGDTPGPRDANTTYMVMPSKKGGSLAVIVEHDGQSNGEIRWAAWVPGGKQGS